MKKYLFRPLADTKKIFGLWWGHCEMLFSTESKEQRGSWGSLALPPAPYALWQVNPSSSASSGFRKISDANCPIPELFFGITEGRWGRGHHRAHTSPWRAARQSQQHPSPSGEAGWSCWGTGHERCLLWLCDQDTGEQPGCSQTKAWKMPSRAGGSSRQRGWPTAATLHWLPAPEKRAGGIVWVLLGFGVFFPPNGFKGQIMP